MCQENPEKQRGIFQKLFGRNIQDVASKNKILKPGDTKHVVMTRRHEILSRESGAGVEFAGLHVRRPR